MPPEPLIVPFYHFLVLIHHSIAGTFFASLPETRSTYDKQVSVDVDWLPPVEVVSLHGVTAIFWQEISSDLYTVFVQCVTYNGAYCYFKNPI